MATAREIEQVWRSKSDEELLEAAGALGEYTPEGQNIIRAELKRRGFEDPVEQQGESALEATGEAPPPRECIRCRVDMTFIGTQPTRAADWIALGHVREIRSGAASFDLYLCPECAHVEMFLSMPVEDDGGAADEATDGEP
jgi:hypothetical protein